ncbi:PP2C family protein-serine/threonine phosphatase [Streptomyces sp. NBC_00083]|uniref:PP2C family protein-serine/threonine phosphatase n=1 Tax=Streptomyces sp. NBC_00083 TaxID=2975647 RepID=UPI0022510805|nr:GAF domain-containing SpoIIE family protein phosphatase [Streptomyces sp. NBC_00083]MCX5387035.1 SpoIIE family protein phosphatase [Streptomyces sp. NBC_00083]
MREDTAPHACLRPAAPRADGMWMLVAPAAEPAGAAELVQASPRARAALLGDATPRWSFTDLLAPTSVSISRQLLLDALHGGGRVFRQPIEYAHPGGAVICMTSARRIDRCDGDPAVLVEIEEEEEGEWLHWEALRSMTVLADHSLWVYDEEADAFSWLDGERLYNGMGPGDTMSLDALLGLVCAQDVSRVEAAFWALRRGHAQRVDVDFRMADEHGRLNWLRTLARLVRFGFDGGRRVVGTTTNTTAAVERHQTLVKAHADARRRGDLVQELAAAFVAAATEDELTAAILNKVAPAFGGTGTLLAFVEDERLRVTFGAGIDPALARSLHGLPLDAPKPLTEAIRTGTPQFIATREDYRRSWPQAHGLLDATSAESFVMIPLRGQGAAPLGGWVVTFDRPHDLSNQERTLVGVMADVAGQAWERIRLQSARTELAGTVQRDLLPATLPAVVGYEIEARYSPAHEGLDVGGDWYDVIALPDGGTACIIGDVQGHNVQAAALMGQVRTAMHAYAWQEPAPDQVLARTNDLMLQMRMPVFATCLYALLTPDGRVVTARAGHVPLVHSTGDGAQVREYPGGPPLGVVPGSRFPVHALEMAPGDLLALVTDGLVEGPRLPIDAGLAVICEATARRREAPLAEIADVLMAQTDSMTGHVDDRAVLVVRRSGREESGA